MDKKEWFYCVETATVNEKLGQTGFYAEMPISLTDGEREEFMNILETGDKKAIHKYAGEHGCLYSQSLVFPD